jgi:uncharacterized protein YcbX
VPGDEIEAETTPMAESAATIVGIYRYPVKGLSPEAMASVNLNQGETLPFDRAYAIENGPGRFDPAAPAHLPKTNFLMLMRDERLATLETRFDEATHRLTICRGGKPVVTGDLLTRTGRALIEQFMAAYMRDSLRGAPKIVVAPGHSFSDVAAKCLHVVNLASVRELEREVGRPVHPLRFRPNLVIDGAAPWSEFSWLGAELSAGGARLVVVKRTSRCAATNVDPMTGHRDMDIPAVLARKWGHIDFGVYARVTGAGPIAAGDSVR